MYFHKMCNPTGTSPSWVQPAACGQLCDYIAMSTLRFPLHKCAFDLFYYNSMWACVCARARPPRCVRPSVLSAVDIHVCVVQSDAAVAAEYKRYDAMGDDQPEATWVRWVRITVGRSAALTAKALQGLADAVWGKPGNASGALSTVVSTVRALMAAHMGSEEVQRWGCDALGCLVESYPSPAVAAEAVLAAGGLSTLLAAMAQYPASVTVQMSACAAVYRMARASVPARTALTAGGAVEACTRATSVEPTGTAEYALKALAGEAFDEGDTSDEDDE